MTPMTSRLTLIAAVVGAVLLGGWAVSSCGSDDPSLTASTPTATTRTPPPTTTTTVAPPVTTPTAPETSSTTTDTPPPTTSVEVEPEPHSHDFGPDHVEPTGAGDDSTIITPTASGEKPWPLPPLDIVVDTVSWPDRNEVARNALIIGTEFVHLHPRRADVIMSQFRDIMSVDPLRQVQQMLLASPEALKTPIPTGDVRAVSISTGASGERQATVLYRQKDVTGRTLQGVITLTFAPTTPEVIAMTIRTQESAS